ncbi:hypothetical protein BDR04DRAFT_1054870 [Suillus decipiens]|nr:hypothetical protein BDR04DRAFT_1054870 [Suillus decipiens]
MSSSAQDLISQLDIENTFGALFIGVTIAAVLFGLSNAQAFIYFQTHRNTGKTIYKLTVIWLWIFDALHLALIIHCMYYYLVINYSNVNALTEIVWSFKASSLVLRSAPWCCDIDELMQLSLVIEVFIVYLVHLLYVYRIWILSKTKSKTLPIVVGIVIILNSGVAIVLIWTLYQSQTFSDWVKFEWATYLALATITFADIVIAATLCYLLATSRVGSSSTDSLITKLMAYIINTGCLTSVCSMAAVITCAVMPKNFIFLAIEFLLAKVYVNSFLALLNARHYGQISTDTNCRYQFQNHQRAYRAELHIRALENQEPQASRRDMFQHPNHEAVDLSGSVNRLIAATTDMTEMNSSSFA